MLNISFLFWRSVSLAELQTGSLWAVFLIVFDLACQEVFKNQNLNGFRGNVNAPVDHRLPPLLLSVLIYPCVLFQIFDSAIFDFKFINSWIMTTDFYWVFTCARICFRDFHVLLHLNNLKVNSKGLVFHLIVQWCYSWIYKSRVWSPLWFTYRRNLRYNYWLLTGKMPCLL